MSYDDTCVVLCPDMHSEKESLKARRREVIDMQCAVGDGLCGKDESLNMLHSFGRLLRGKRTCR